MKSIHVMPFRLGQTTSEPVGEKGIQFYRWLASRILGTDEVSIYGQADLRTIPVDNKVVVSENYQIQPLYLEQRAKIHDDQSLVIIELTNPFDSIIPGKFLSNLAMVVAEEGDPRMSGTIFCLLIPEVPPAAEFYRTVLESRIRSGSVIIVGDAGSTLPEQIEERFGQEYNQRLAASRRPPVLERLEMKLIRRRGHFQIHNEKGDHVSCKRFYFNGRMCTDEIELLTEEYINEIRSKGENVLLLYEDDAQEWLLGPILALSQRRQVEHNTVSGAIASQATKSDLRPLIVTAMVDSGRTIKKLIKTLMETGMFLSPHILAVLTTASTDDVKRLRRIVTKNHGDFDIHYMMTVTRDTFSTDNCEMCKLSIPAILDPEVEQFDMLTSYQMWDMVKEAGLTEEPDVPAYRAGIDLLPAYPLIIEKNAAWVVSKVQQLLQNAAGGYPADPVIVCPDEIGSSAFCDAMRSILGVGVVRVPREVINSHSGNGRDGAGATYGEWRRKLADAVSDDLIIMDIFLASGKTLHGLTNLVIEAGGQVHCYLVFNNLNPAISSGFHAPICSLYEWQHYGYSL